MSYTFKGEKYRARLSLLDRTGAHIPEEKREEKLIFKVEVLKASEPPRKQFIHGAVVYEGYDFEAAWTVIKFYAGHQLLPRKLQKLRWSD